MNHFPRRWLASLVALLCAASVTNAVPAAAAAATADTETEPTPHIYSYGEYSPDDSLMAGVFEMSGLAPSNQERLDGVYWSVQDHHPSEERRFLYRMRYDAQVSETNRNGLVIDAAIPIDVPLDPADDWEAVATDQVGNVYIGDTGAGESTMPREGDRTVYMISAEHVLNWTGGALTPARTWTYASGAASAAGLIDNVEAMFNIDDEMYLLSRGANGRVAKLDANGEGLLAVPGALEIYPALSQVSGAEVSHDGHTMIALTRGNGFQLKSSYIYPRQDLAPLSADEKAVKLLAQFGAGSNALGVSSHFEHPQHLEFEGVAFADTGARAIDGSAYSVLRRDDNAYALMVTDRAPVQNNQVYRIPAQEFRQGVTCSVTHSTNGVPDAAGDRVMVSWDGFDANDAHDGSASIYVRRAVVDPTAGGRYYWQGNIGRNVHQLEQFVNHAPKAKDVRYMLFPRQDLPGGLTNQDMFIAVPCGGVGLGETLTCSAIWNADGDIEIAWNHSDLPDRSYQVLRAIDDGAEDLRAEGLLATRYVDEITGHFATLDFRVVVLSGSTSVHSADCGTIFDPVGELACSVTSTGSTDRIIWDRFKGSNFADLPDASLAKVKVFRQAAGTTGWFQQGFFGVNTDTIYQDNRDLSFTYRLEVWVDANGTQQPLPDLVICA